MSNPSIDKVIGRVKEAVGALTANKHLKHEGRVDQAKGSIKSTVDKVAEAVTATSSDEPKS